MRGSSEFDACSSAASTLMRRARDELGEVLVRRHQIREPSAQRLARPIGREFDANFHTAATGCGTFRRRRFSPADTNSDRHNRDSRERRSRWR